MRTVYILLPTYNRVNTVSKFIECLKLQTYSRYELLLIDDASTDNTIRVCTELLPNIHVVHGDGNLWWAGSLQKGIDYLFDILKPEPSDIILMANDDTTFEPDFFECGIRLLDANPRTLILPKWKMLDTGAIKETGAVYDPYSFSFRPSKAGEEINLFTTMCLFLRWSDVVEIGGFYPRLLPHYNSDSEYTYRAYKKGFRLMTTDELLIVPDRTKTGFHKDVFREMGVIEFVSKYFHRRSSSNPFCKISMILLTSPKSRVVQNIFKVLNTVCVDFWMAVKNSFGVNSERSSR